MDIQVVPIWLPRFLEPANDEYKDRYFAVCKEHGATNQKGHTRRGQKNYYCVDCKMGPLCDTGKVDHGGHSVLQVRRCSREYVVRVSDISTLFNIDHIQPFLENHKEVVFLPTRPQDKPAKGSPSHCDVCGRGLDGETARFCSLSCKVKAIEGHPRGISPAVPKKKTARSSSKKGREKEAPAVAKKKRARKDEKKDGEKDALSYAPSPPVCGPPAIQKKRSSGRSRSLSKNEFAPATPDQPFYELPESPDTVLSSHDDDADDEADNVSSGYRSSSSQDSLETRMTSFPKRSRNRRRKRDPNCTFIPCICGNTYHFSRLKTS